SARFPAGPVRVVVEAPDEGPGLPGVARLEERGRLHAAVERVGLIGTSRSDLPDLLQGKPRVGGELEGGGLRRSPLFSEIVGGLEDGAEVKAVGAGPKPAAPVPRVVGQRVDGGSREVGAAALPA